MYWGLLPLTLFPYQVRDKLSPTRGEETYVGQVYGASSHRAGNNLERKGIRPSFLRLRYLDYTRYKSGQALRLRYLDYTRYKSGQASGAPTLTHPDSLPRDTNNQKQGEPFILMAYQTERVKESGNVQESLRLQFSRSRHLRVPAGILYETILTVTLRLHREHDGYRGHVEVQSVT